MKSIRLSTGAAPPSLGTGRHRLRPPAPHAPHLSAVTKALHCTSPFPRNHRSLAPVDPGATHLVRASTAARRALSDDPPRGRRRAAGVLAAVWVVAMFASFVLVSRAGMRTTLGPMDLLALRFAVAGVLMLPLFVRHRLIGLSAPQALALALSGGLGFAALAYAGFALAPASHGSSLIHGTLPLTTLVVAWLAYREPAGAGRLKGALVIALGVTLLAAEGIGTWRPAQLLGDALLFAASAAWSAYGLLARRFRVATLPAAALVAVLSATLYLPVYLLSGAHGLLSAAPAEVLWQAVFQGAVIGVISLLAYTKAIEILGAATTTLFAAWAPALTTLLAVPLLGEHPAPLGWLGVALITLGIGGSAWLALASTAERPRS